jgi:formylglycine-generating enzyme required for sulfatase activity
VYTERWNGRIRCAIGEHVRCDGIAERGLVHGEGGVDRFRDGDWGTLPVSVSGNLPGTYTNSLGMTFILLPAGTFTMGSPSDEPGRFSNEGPQHQVTLTQSFYMQQTEVTQAQWEAVMGSNPSSFSGCPSCPVEEVSWDDVQTYISYMNVRGEGTYNLPTEAQWEYAERAGSTTAFYNGGITETGSGYDPNLDAIGWYSYNSGSETHPVAQKTPNAWGLYDMSGNVYEWCQDWYSGSYYDSSPSTDPAGPSSGSSRVLRGGSWIYYARSCRSAYRINYGPGNRYKSIGFRLTRQP